MSIACVASINREGQGEREHGGEKVGDWGLGTKECLLQYLENLRFFCFENKRN